MSMNRPADYVHSAAVSADQDAVVSLSNGIVRLMGYSFREAAGSPGTYEADIVDGATASGGTEVAHIEGAADSSTTQWFGPDGIDMKSGSISINVASGTVDATVYFKVD